MANPPVIPFERLQPWGQPQSLEQWPRAAGPQASMVGRGGPTAMPGAKATPVRDPHHYALLNGSASLAIGTISTLILASPPTYRNFFVLRNIGATNIYLDFGTSAAVNRSPIRLVTNAILIFDAVVPQDDVFCVSDAVGGIVGLSYSNVAYSGIDLTGPTA